MLIKVNVVVQCYTRWDSVFCDCVFLVQPTLGLVSGTLSGSVNNGRITCRFQRLRSVATATNKRRRSARQAASDTLFSLDESSYFILLAKGPVSEGWLWVHNIRQNTVTDTNISIVIYTLWRKQRMMMIMMMILFRETFPTEDDTDAWPCIPACFTLCF